MKTESAGFIVYTAEDTFDVIIGKVELSSYPNWLVIQNGRRMMYSPPGTVWYDLPAPSETLRTLVTGFHTHQAAYPIIDKLIEEYPELEPHIMAAYVG